MAKAQQKVDEIDSNIENYEESLKADIKVNSLTKEIFAVNPLLKIISKRRLIFDRDGKELPEGSRYIMFITPRKRKIIFEPKEISDYLQMIESGKAIGNFQFECIDNLTIKLIYKLNMLTIPQEILKWITNALKEIQKTIKNIDK